jgi:D-sedoheptulose 7-phosphate isomerase
VSIFTDNIAANIAVQSAMLSDALLLANLKAATEMAVLAFGAGRKLLFCGNGGSAADAQHLAAEFSGRFYLDRPALFAEALHVNTSYLTAVANDYGYDEVYARLLQGIGQAGDMLFAISTSGNSPNILRVAQVARQKNIAVVALTGSTGGKLAQYADILLNVPSHDTPRIQEAHILLGHCICQSVEAALYDLREG